MAKRVYFAFHYQDVIDFRANVVRNHNLTGGVEKAGYFDASIWEEARIKNPLLLKRMINSELEYTTVTAVLIGSDTYARPWVRYEIFKSLERHNSLIGVHINGIKGKDGKTKTAGSNPFDHLALRMNLEGTRATPTIWQGDKWIDYPELGAFAINGAPAAYKGLTFQLSKWSAVRVYDWVTQNGFNNFNMWL